MHGFVVDSLSQHVDDAAPAELFVESREELPAYRGVGVERERLSDLGLRVRHEAAELVQVDADATVILLRVTEYPARTSNQGRRRVARRACRLEYINLAGHRADDQGFEALLRGVRGHGASSLPDVLGSCWRGPLLDRLLTRERSQAPSKGPTG